MEQLVILMAYGTLILNISFLVLGALYLMQRFTSFDYREYSLLESTDSFLRERHLELSFLFATVATSGSLFLSNVLQWEPCQLCWFQRIFMYPIVLLTGVAILFEKKDSHEYVIPLVLIGGSIAIYHYVIQRFDQYSSAGCSVLSVSCSTTYTFYFEYITIPVMALTAFTAIGILMWKFRN